MFDSNYIDEKRRVKSYSDFQRLRVGRYLIIHSPNGNIYLERKLDKRYCSDLIEPIRTQIIEILHMTVGTIYDKGHIGYWDFQGVKVYKISKKEVFAELL